MEDLADTRLAPKISQLPGVGLVSISGGQKPAVRIQANPTQLASYGLNLEDLRTAIIAANVESGQGKFRRPASGVPDRRERSAAVERGLCAADHRLSEWRSGQADRCGEVKDDIENVRQAAWMNQTPAVILNIQRQPGANIISVVDRIKKLLPQLTSSLPKSVKVSMLTDRTTTIRASVSGRRV